MRLSSADNESARGLADAIGEGAVIGVDNRGELQGADAVILALSFSVLKDVIEEIADALDDKSLLVPSNPVGLDAQGQVVRLLPEGQSTGTSPGDAMTDRDMPLYDLRAQHATMSVTDRRD